MNEFQPENIIVVDRENDASTFTRHTTEELAAWLEDYKLGRIVGDEFDWWETVMMRNVFIYVEGQTEETFVKTVLQPHLLNFNIRMKPFNCYGTIKYKSNLRKFILRKANEDRN